LARIQNERNKEMRTNAGYFCSLLHSQISIMELPAKRTIQWNKRKAGDCDLVDSEEPKQSFIEGIIWTSLERFSYLRALALTPPCDALLTASQHALLRGRTSASNHDI
jgi:hypothetical protein